MNNGAFGENFPYSNFHDLNMDWIIKIAKDFLDQYTHIQEIIANGEQSLQDLTTSGLEQLQEKADALEALLQQWYETHSADIANQLADALKDLNNWYTEHQNYLDATLQANITAFNNAADQKAQQTIASIPSDYTTLSNTYFGPRIPNPSATTLASMKLAGVYKLESAQVRNITDLPSDADHGTTSTLINYTNAYSGGGFIYQELFQLTGKVWRRLIIASDNQVYVDWYRIDTLDMYQAHSIPNGTTSMTSLVNPGMYAIPTNIANNLTDWPSNYSYTTTTLLVFNNSYNGAFTTQFLLNPSDDMVFRTLETNTGVVFQDWRSVRVLYNNGIIYAALGDSRTNVPEINVKYPDVVKTIKGYKTALNFGVGGATFVKIKNNTSAFEICNAHDFSGVNVVTFNFGYNDYANNTPIGTPGNTGDTTVCGAIYKCISKIYAENPNCSIYFFTPIPNINGPDATFNSYVEAIVNTCKYFNIPVFNCSEEGALPTPIYNSFFYDGVHSRDYTIIGTWMASHLP